MLKKLSFALILIMVLSIAKPIKQNNIFIAAEKDLIEWNGYEVEDILA